MSRGWTSTDLKAVGDDDRLWTVADAAAHLGPLPGDDEHTPMEVTVTKLRNLARYHHLQPAGKRRSTQPGRAGRHARVYPASAFITLYERMEPEMAA